MPKSTPRIQERFPDSSPDLTEVDLAHDALEPSCSKSLHLEEFSGPTLIPGTKREKKNIRRRHNSKESRQCTQRWKELFPAMQTYAGKRPSQEDTLCETAARGEVDGTSRGRGATPSAGSGHESCGAPGAVVWKRRGGVSGRPRDRNARKRASSEPAGVGGRRASDRGWDGWVLPGIFPLRAFPLAISRALLDTGRRQSPGVSPKPPREETSHPSGHPEANDGA